MPAPRRSQDVTVHDQPAGGAPDRRHRARSIAALDAASADVARRPRDFLRAKLLEKQQRHHKFEDTPYSLEPNFKESPGGLRDLQMVLWVARAARLGAVWKALVAAGVIDAARSRQLQRNERVLKRIRARLHIVAGRREDRLVFDLQTAVPRAHGLSRRRSPRRLSEALMQRYYLAAKAITQLQPILLQQHRVARARRARPGEAARHRRRLRADRRPARHPRDPTLSSATRNVILRAFLLLQQPPELSGHVGAHAAGALARALPHRRAVPRRPGQPRRLPGDPAGAARASRTSCGG